MTQTHDDNGLREEFRRLRSETEGSARVPDFRAMLEKTKADELARPELRVVRGGRSDPAAPRRRLVWIGGWASAAVAATIAGVRGSHRRCGSLKISTRKVLTGRAKL